MWLNEFKTGDIVEDKLGNVVEIKQIFKNHKCVNEKEILEKKYQYTILMRQINSELDHNYHLFILEGNDKSKHQLLVTA